MSNSELITRRFSRQNLKAKFWDKQTQLKARDRVLDKLSNKIYLLKDANCPVCGKDKVRVLTERDAYGLPFGTVICLNCSCVYTSPRLTDESIKAFYDNEYRDIERGKILSLGEYFQLQVNKGESIYDYLFGDSLIKSLKNKLVVEIGCGAGGTLYYFHQNGFPVLGCDYGSKFLDYGIAKYGLNLFQGNIESICTAITESSLPVGLIIYEQTFEHLANPAGELQSLKKIMDRNTFLYIGVPGFRNIDNHYDSDLLQYLRPGHLIHFDLTNLSFLLKHNGFEIVKGDETIRALFRLTDNDYLAVIPQEPGEVWEFFSEMEKRRRILFRKRLVKYLLEGINNRVNRAFKTIIKSLPISETRKNSILNPAKKLER